MNNLLISEKIIEGKKINVLPKKSPIIKENKEETDLHLGLLLLKKPQAQRVINI